MDIVNLDGEKQRLGACSVGGVTLENTDKDNMVYQLLMEKSQWENPH